MVEVYDDVALRRCPITRLETHSMIAEGQRSPVASGLSRTASGGPRGVADTLVRVPYLATYLEGPWQSRTHPLIVLSSGQGVKAADALVVFRST